jgi:hypothetical protein
VSPADSGSHQATPHQERLPGPSSGRVELPPLQKDVRLPPALRSARPELRASVPLPVGSAPPEPRANARQQLPSAPPKADPDW